MNFINPLFLYLLLPPLAIFAYFILKGRANLESFFSKEVLDKILIKGDKLGSRGRHVFLFVALFLFVLALARPISNQSEVEIKETSKNLVIAIDISRSMTVDDIYPNRLEFVKNRLKWFINHMSQTNIGIIAFAKDAFLVSPVTSDKRSLEFLLDGLSFDIVSRQGTNITNALIQIDKMFPKNGIKDVFLISDGGENNDIQKAIKEATKDNLHVSVMVVGSKKGGTIKTENGLLKDKNGNIVISKRNDNLLELSEKTGGVYIKEFGQGGGVELLKKSLQAKKNDKNKTTIKTQKEWFMLPLILGFLCVFVSLHGLPKMRFLTFVFPLLFTLPSHAHAGVFDFMKLKDIDNALEKKEYQKAIDGYNSLEQTPQISYNKANAYYKMKKYDEALKEYEKVKTKDKNLQIKTHFNKGNTYAQKKEFKKALSEYEKAKKLAPKDKDIDKNIEYVKKQMKKKEQKKNNQNDKNKKDNKKNQQKKDNKQNQQNKQQNNKNEQKQSQQNKQKDAQNDKQKKDKNQKNQAKKDKNQSKAQQGAKAKKEDDKEGKKWEKILLQMNPKTNPVKLGQSKNEGDENEITW